MGRHAVRDESFIDRAVVEWFARPKLRLVVGIVLTVVLVMAFLPTLRSSESNGVGRAASDAIVEEPVAPVGEFIETSAPVEMYVPALDLRADFETEACRTKDGVIDPKTMDLACAYTSEDKPYSLPGTDAEDIVVIAGHTGAAISGVFDKLYDGAADRHNVAVDDVLYLRTEASGDRWLKYRATDLHSPQKEGLSQSVEIWGSGPTPGRLLTISCIQPAHPLAASVRNAVVGWQFEGVVAQDSVGV